MKEWPTIRVYVASKAVHGDRWVKLRQSLREKETDVEIVSTWIDEAGEGQTADYGELSQRCFREISAADALWLFCLPDEILKGALVEVGMALALGKKVIYTGPVNAPSISRVFRCHPLWYEAQVDKVIGFLQELRGRTT